MTRINLSGISVKLKTTHCSDQSVQYRIGFCQDGMTKPSPSEEIILSSYLGRTLELEFNGQIQCLNCQKFIKKSYFEGHCFPCSQKLASCDTCIIKPEKCHYHKGTCREPEWGEKNCLQPHFVYLANSSGIKVGITRKVNVPYRWMDQGAIAAVPVFQVNGRLQSGVLEHSLKEYFVDKTNWRKMLKNEVESVDLTLSREQLFYQCEDAIEHFIDIFGEDDLEYLEDQVPYEFKYPVLSYPQKITALNLEKTPKICGQLLGIKGQYLILDIGVINIRKYTGYHLEWTLRD